MLRQYFAKLGVWRQCDLSLNTLLPRVVPNFAGKTVKKKVNLSQRKSKTNPQEFLQKHPLIFADVFQVFLGPVRQNMPHKDAFMLARWSPTCFATLMFGWCSCWWWWWWWRSSSSSFSIFFVFQFTAMSAPIEFWSDHGKHITMHHTDHELPH